MSDALGIGVKLRAAIARYADLDGLTMDVGIQSAQGATVKEARDAVESGRQPTLAEVAAANEFGVPSRGIPARPFLRESGKEYGRAWGKRWGAAAKQVVRGQGPEGFSTLGVVLVSDVKRKITDGPWAPNAPLTVRLKGSDRPLIDTGQLRNSIRAAIQARGKAPVVVG